MGETGKYYDAADFSNWKKKLGSAYKAPPRPNFLAAASYIRNLLEGKKINWAASGSLAMLCLGSRREMPDIHIVYDDGEFSRIKHKLEGDRRVRLPKGMNSLFPAKLLVSTGPKFKDVGCMENADIEVDLIPPGSHGAPSSDVLRDSQVMLRLNVNGQTTNFRGLNMVYLVRSTLRFCNIQGLVWDPRQDMLFLCRNFGKEIEAIRGQLVVRDVQNNLLGTEFFSRLAKEDQHLCYNVLLGRDPPPSMSLTPAPSLGKRGAPSEVRPPINSHKSSPALNTAAQLQSNLLTPPSHGKPRPRTTGPPTNIPPVPKSAPPVPQQGPPRSSTEGRDAQSRYRTSSAPNISNGRVNTSPKANTLETSQVQMMNMRELKQPVGNSPHQAFAGAQNALTTHLARQHIVNNASPPSSEQKGVRPQKPVPIYTHSQGGAPPMHNHSSSYGKTTKEGLLPPFGKTPYQDRNLPQAVMQNVPNQNKPRLPAANNTGNEQSSHLHHPQKHSPPTLHSNNDPLLNNRMGSAPEKELRLVGPEGVYGPPPSRSNSGEKQTKAPGVSKQKSSNSLEGFVFELDASSPQAISPPSNNTGNFIAELPAESDGAGTMRNHPGHMVASPPLLSYNVSPIIPAVEIQPLNPQIRQEQPPQLQLHTQQSTHPPPQAMPPNPRAHSDALAALPSSLTIGGPGKRRSQSNSISSQIPPQQIQQHIQMQALLAPENQKYAPNPNRISVYKAYQAPTTPPKSPPRLPAMPAVIPSNGLSSSLPSQDSTLMQHAPSPPHKQDSSRTAVSPLRISPQVAAPLATNTDQQAPSQNQQPDALKIRPPEKPLQKTPRHLLPNPLRANPPAPSLTKHDSHQGYSENSTNETNGAAAAGVGAASGYAAYTFHQNSSYNENSDKPRYMPFKPSSTQQPQLPQIEAIHMQTQAQNQTPPAQLFHTLEGFKPTHQRTISSESHSSTASHDSQKLAGEYQMSLPDFGEGYGGRGEGKLYEMMGKDADEMTIYDFT